MNSKLQRQLHRLYRLAGAFVSPSGPSFQEENIEMFAELGSNGTKDLREISPLVVIDGEEGLASPEFMDFVQGLIDLNQSLIERLASVEKAIHTLVAIEKARETSKD